MIDQWDRPRIQNAKGDQMATEGHWERVNSINAHDGTGNTYEIVHEQWVATFRPISGSNSGQIRSVKRKSRYTCGGEPVNPLPNGQYRLVRQGIILTPDLPGA